MTRVKICGVMTPEDARRAADAGADAIGMIFAPSPRRVTARQAREIVAALPPLVLAVGVFVDAPRDEIIETIGEARLDMVQFHGDESPDDCATLPVRVIKRLPITPLTTHDELVAEMETFAVAAFLLDPGAGDGVTFDWNLARGLGERVVIAGGLTPENVGAAVRIVRPRAVDVSSGVEASPGQKDVAKMQAFISAVRQADADADE